jgi:hypothetical protein
MTVLVLTMVPMHGFADAEVGEWVGQYAMNHDGHHGTLSIRDSKMDCASSAWCALRLHYTGGDGNQRSGTIDVIDDRFQHMVFHVDFPGNRQKFDAYLFSWDKAKIAGTTYWGGRTFGFFATK